MNIQSKLPTTAHGFLRWNDGREDKREFVHGRVVVRYPDIVVDRKTATSKGTDLAATQPPVLAEILSSSSLGRDFVEKLSEYKAVPSVLHVEVSDQEQPIELSGIGLSIPFADLYAGIQS